MLRAPYKDHILAFHSAPAYFTISRFFLKGENCLGKFLIVVRATTVIEILTFCKFQTSQDTNFRNAPQSLISVPLG